MNVPCSFAEQLPRVNDLTAMLGDGRPVNIHPSPKGAFLAIQAEGPVELVIEHPEGWEGTVVKPARAGAVVSIHKTRLRISVERPRPLLVEGPGGRLLSILLKPPAGAPPEPGPGGRLFQFESGRLHEPGLIELKDNDVLWIEPGAWVRGQVHASGAENITIGGSGVLENPPGSEPRYRTILLDHCRHVRISSIHMMTTDGWMITLGGCEDVHINGISQISHNGGTDGIDIVGSRNVHVRNAFLMNSDDCIAIKAMNLHSQTGKPNIALDQFNGDWTENVRDILVESCALFSDHGGSAMEIGYETRADKISGIVFRDIDVMAVHHFGSVFGIHTGDRAAISGVTWEDIRVEHHYDMLIDFRILHSRWNKDPERGTVSNVVLRNIRIHQNPFNEGYTISVIGGWDAAHQITDVVIQDFLIDGKRVTNADDLCLYQKQTANLSIS